MDNKHTRQMIEVFKTLPRHLYQADSNTNKNVGSIGVSKSLSQSDYQSYRTARVEKLRQLYEENPVEIKKTWVLPTGETDGRKSIVEEEIISNDFSPFDMPDFEEQMPNWKDYINEYGD